MGSIDAPEWLRKKTKEQIASKEKDVTETSIPAPDWLKKKGNGITDLNNGGTPSPLPSNGLSLLDTGSTPDENLLSGISGFGLKKSNPFNFENISYAPKVQLGNGAILDIDPKAIPISVISNPVEYVSGLQQRISTGKQTKQDESFIQNQQRNNKIFNGNDYAELNDISGRYQISMSDEDNTDKNISTVKQLKEKIIQNYNYRTVKERGDGIPETGMTDSEKNDLLNLSDLEKKLSFEKSKSDLFPIYNDVEVRTDESGNLLKKAVSRLALLNPNTISSGVAAISQEAQDRIERQPTEFSIGLNSLKYTEPEQYKRVTKMLTDGAPLSETMVANISAQGAEAKEAIIKDTFIAGKIDQTQYQKDIQELQKVRYETLVNNKETLRAFLSNGIANVADDVAEKNNEKNLNQSSKIFGNRWAYTDEEIANYGKSYAQANGIDPNDSRVKEAIKYLQDNEGSMILQNSIAKNGYVRDLAKGLASPIRGVVASIEDLGKSNNAVYNEGQSQGNVNVSEQKIDRVKNSWENTVADVLEGTGQFITQAGLAYVTSGAIGGLGRAALGRAGVAALEGDIAVSDLAVKDLIGKTLLQSSDKLATFITSYAQSYDSNKKQALTYTSDESKANITANLMSGLEGATELFLSPLDIARGIGNKLFNKKEMSRSLVDIISDAAIIDKNAAVKNYLKASLRGGLGTTKVLGAEIGEEFVTQIADYTANSILNPESKTFADRDLTNELVNTAYQTGLSMVIPALAAGAGAFNVNNFSKGSLLIAGQNRQQLIDEMNQRLFDGNMTQDEVNEKTSIINSAAKANETLPSKENGNKLNSNEKADYVFSRVSEGVLKRKLEESNDEAEKSIIEGKIKKQQDFRKEILNSTENENVQASTTIEVANGENTQPQNAEIAAAQTKITQNNETGLLVESAIIEINGKTYEGKNHAEAILSAQEDGQDISQVNRQAEGKFKLSDGTIIDRAEAKTRFGQDRSELLIPQDEAANQANKDYAKSKSENKQPVGSDDLKDVESKKADIEKRRQEELDSVDIAKGGKLPIEGYEEFYKKVNEKYDAELEALTPKQESKAPTVSNWESNIAALVHPETGLGAVTKKILDEQQPLKDAFLKRIGLSIEEYRKLDEAGKEKVQQQWVKSKEFEKLSNKEPEKSAPTVSSEVEKDKGSVVVKEGFTEGADLNEIYSGLKVKYGDKKAAMLYEAANRLVNPNKNTIVEIRGNGVVVKEDGKYILKPFGNTDANSKKWTLYKGLDITDQFKGKEQTQGEAAQPNKSAQDATEINTNRKEVHGLQESSEQGRNQGGAGNVEDPTILTAGNGQHGQVEGREAQQQINEGNKITDVNEKAAEVSNTKEKASPTNEEANPVEPAAGKAAETFKGYADTFRKLKSKPFTFTDSDGNVIELKTNGITWNDAIELGAKAIEATGKIIDGVNKVIDSIKNEDWYKAIKDKDGFKEKLEEHYKESNSDNNGGKKPPVDDNTETENNEDDDFIKNFTLPLAEKKAVNESLKTDLAAGYSNDILDQDDMVDSLELDAAVNELNKLIAAAKNKFGEQVIDYAKGLYTHFKNLKDDISKLGVMVQLKNDLDNERKLLDDEIQELKRVDPTNPEISNLTDEREQIVKQLRVIADYIDKQGGEASKKFAILRLTKKLRGVAVAAKSKSSVVGKETEQKANEVEQALEEPIDNDVADNEDVDETPVEFETKTKGMRKTASADLVKKAKASVARMKDVKGKLANLGKEFHKIEEEAKKLC